jgi:DNA-directed RNA polymerase specialized sigma24 family protein
MTRSEPSAFLASAAVKGDVPTTTRPAAVVRRTSGSGTKRLDPEVLVAHLGHLLRAAWALCGSRESAEDLVQETVARILSRPRLLRAEDERAYLMRTLRNTFLTSRRTAARRPHIVTTLQDLDAADPRAGARPEEAVIAGKCSRRSPGCRSPSGRR